MMVAYFIYLLVIAKAKQIAISEEFKFSIML